MNAITRPVALVLATALSLGCNNVSSPPVDGARLGSRVAVWLPPSTAVLVHEYYSGLGDAAQVIITDAATWSAVWAQLYLSRQPQPPLPSVDFGTERVLVAALGTRGTGGYDIHVDSLVRFEHGSVTYVTTWAPGQTCGTTQALTQPVEMLRLSPPPTEPILFDQQAVVRECTSGGTARRRP
jgi:hypothetical protein